MDSAAGQLWRSNDAKHWRRRLCCYERLGNSDGESYALLPGKAEASNRTIVKPRCFWAGIPVHRYSDLSIVNPLSEGHVVLPVDRRHRIIYSETLAATVRI